MVKLTLEELGKLKDWEGAVIVFKQESFIKPYTEQQRSYKVYSDAKYFNHKMNGNSLFGNCLDESEHGVRLDHYMYGKCGWKVDYCYICNNDIAPMELQQD